MEKKLINVGTEDYSLWIPVGVPVTVMGVKRGDLDDHGNPILLKSQILFHDGSSRVFESPLLASQIVKLIENSNSGIPGMDN